MSTEINYEWFRKRARSRLPKVIFEYIDRGAEDEVALRYNRQKLDSIKMMPRVLNDVSSRSQRIVLFGRQQQAPLIVSPTAAAGLVWYQGEIELARAATQAGIPFTAATEAITAIEEVAEHAKGNVWCQLYLWNDRQLSFELIERARLAGVETLVLTADTAALPKREYNVRNGFDLPMSYSPRMLLNIACHPGWLFGTLARYVLNGGMPGNANYPAQFRSTIIRKQDTSAVAIASTVDWDDFADLRRRWKGNLILKGVLHPEVAVRAHAAGADGIIVSNHGGRLLDCAVHPTDILSIIVDAVGHKLTVLADSGVRRGSDALALLAMGAKAVLCGRAFVYGVATAGQSGAFSAIEMLKDEIDRTMAYLGCRSIDEIRSDLLATHLNGIVHRGP